MNSITKTTEITGKKALLATLWIFAMLNYLYCDVISLMDPEFLKQYLTGNVGGVHITQGFLLGGAVLMEIPTAMVLLSRVLGHKANRWANIIAGCIMTVVQCSTLFFGSSPTIYYLFFSILEIGCTAFIAGCIMTVVQCSTLFFGSSPTSYYIFFSILEIGCTAFIVWFAWKWASPEGHLENNVTVSANVV